MKQKLLRAMTVMMTGTVLLLVWLFRLNPDIYWVGALNVLIPPLLVLSSLVLVTLQTDLRLLRLATGVWALFCGAVAYYWLVETVPVANWSNLFWAVIGLSLLVATLRSTFVTFKLWTEIDEPSGQIDSGTSNIGGRQKKEEALN